MTAEPPERYSSPSPAGDKLRQLLLLRTIAITGQIITVAVVNSAFDIPLPLLPLAVAIGILALFNLASWLRLRLRQPASDGELFGQILVDTAVFTVLLYFTGGAAQRGPGQYTMGTERSTSEYGAPERGTGAPLAGMRPRGGVCEARGNCRRAGPAPGAHPRASRAEPAPPCAGAAAIGSRSSFSTTG